MTQFSSNSCASSVPGRFPPTARTESILTSAEAVVRLCRLINSKILTSLRCIAAYCAICELRAFLFDDREADNPTSPRVTRKPRSRRSAKVRPPSPARVVARR